MRKLIMYIVCILLFSNGISFALDRQDSGVREIDYNLAKATLDNITTHLEYAEKVVVNDILPYVNSSLYTQQSTGVYAYLVNNTGNTSTFSNWITSVTNTNSGSYVKNPYIYKLAIVNYGLKVQMQFVSAYVTPVSNYATSKLAIFEPFLGRRIILVPNINLTYITTGKGKKKITIVTGSGISDWVCYTDSDETIASSTHGISERNNSIVSIAGGILDGCVFLTAASLNSLWINI